MENNTAKCNESLSQIQTIDMTSLPPPPYDTTVSGRRGPYNDIPNYPYPVQYCTTNIESIQLNVQSPSARRQTTQPTAIVVAQPTQSLESTDKPMYKCHIFWSCLTFWFCWIVFGAFAFFLAYSARRKSIESDLKSARSMGTASIILTVTGIVCGCAAWAILIWWLVDPCYYFIYGACYNTRVCSIGTISDSYCKAYHIGSVYYAGCCYFST